MAVVADQLARNSLSGLVGCVADRAGLGSLVEGESGVAGKTGIYVARLARGAIWATQSTGGRAGLNQSRIRARRAAAEVVSIFEQISTRWTRSAVIARIYSAGVAFLGHRSTGTWTRLAHDWTGQQRNKSAGAGCTFVGISVDAGSAGGVAWISLVDVDAGLIVGVVVSDVLAILRDVGAEEVRGSR